jgi:hypothetical protein
MAGQIAAHGADVLHHGAGVRDNAPRPFEHALALGREALKARTTMHQHDAEPGLELLHGGRERLLCDTAALGGVAEMAVPGEGEEEF